MGMSTGSSGAGGSRRRGRGSRRRAPMSEINVTPMVDVMLVLLIIFMVAAPMLTVGVPIKLPETQAKAINSETTPITIAVDEAGTVYLNDNEVDPDNIVDQLKAIAETGYDERIFVRGDRTTEYGTVMKIMARISAAGFRNIGLVTDQERNA
ncbi:protein TolR [Fulvimarina sp. MAC8]|uniref:protein TolR n=1 Tax=Fulvimarina sp. MAC8 TaxID=3162874 RepID=UPI0032EBC6D7